MKAIKTADLTAGYIRKLFAQGVFKDVPFINTNEGKRIANPAINKISIPAKRKIVRAKAISTYIYPVAVPIPNLVYDPPIIIQTPGLTKITNKNIRSTDSSVPAIQVWNGASVEISGCIIVSCGDMINATGGAILNIHNNSLYGDVPTNGAQYGRALNCYHPKSLTFYNNTVEHSGGILIDHTDGVEVPVTIYNNIIRNTDKRDAAGNSKDHRAGILFNTVPLLSGYIAFNQFVNEMNLSHVEDNINLYNSGGTQLKPFLIHDNYIFGAYPYPLISDSYTGSGITMDGDPGTNQLNNMTQWVNIYNNQIVSTCNACMNIAAGHDIHSYNNTYLSSGMYPDGTVSQRFWGGCCIWDASNVGANFVNNSQKNNVIGYARPDVNVPYKGRQDWVVVDSNLFSIKAGDNTSLPDAPITLDMENAELTKWNNKLISNGITIGANGSITPPIMDVSLKLGQSAHGVFTPVNDKGETVTFQQGTLKLVSNDATIATMAINATIGNVIDIVSLKVGTTIGTLSLIDNQGNPFSKTFSMEVLAAPPITNDKIVDIKFIFTIN